MVNQQADMEVVAEASDGEEAIALYEQHRPDVMVLDLRMPSVTACRWYSVCSSCIPRPASSS